MPHKTQRHSSLSNTLNGSTLSTVACFSLAFLEALCTRLVSDAAAFLHTSEQYLVGIPPTLVVDTEYLLPQPTQHFANTFGSLSSAIISALALLPHPLLQYLRDILDVYTVPHVKHSPKCTGENGNGLLSLMFLLLHSQLQNNPRRCVRPLSLPAGLYVNALEQCLQLRSCLLNTVMAYVPWKRQRGFDS